MPSIVFLFKEEFGNEELRMLF